MIRRKVRRRDIGRAELIERKHTLEGEIHGVSAEVKRRAARGEATADLEVRLDRLRSRHYQTRLEIDGTGPEPGQSDRALSADPIARGRTAEIYALDNRRVVKLLLPGFDPQALRLEAELTAAAHAAGAPAPAVLGSLEADGRPGVVFERIPGRSVARLLPARLWKLRSYARLLAEMHWELHRCTSTDLPRLGERLAAKIDAADPLPPDLRRKAKDALLRLDGIGDTVLHGDFHADNVLLTPSGPKVIDWVDASRGHPAADLARSQWLSSAAALPPTTPLRPLFARMADTLGREYFGRYLRISGLLETLVHAWRLPVLAGRVSEGIEHEEGSLVAEIRRLVA